ncbi:MAG: 50S ribosomal protein L4 [Proteobacteria bacterium]|nr:50S ribosomal protein L4 [Desulfobulbaceae bacterium]MBU4154427.1 50S ribosomal protein L4 [Pseudomonadota bacterium]
MPVTNLYNIKKEKLGELHLNDDVFGVDVNTHLLHSVVRMQLAGRRSGNACTKTRVEVRGSSAKPFKQKGTGRARAGSKRSPLWRGGGVSHGPKPRDYSLKLSKKAKRLGLKMALSARVAENNVTVLDDFQLDTIKTKNFVSVMNGFEITNALIVVPEELVTLVKSSRNVHGFQVVPTIGLNVYDILRHKHLILLQNSIELLEKRLLS